MRLLKKYPIVFLVLIMLLGLGLRLNQLGRDSFWHDEVDVAIAVQQPTLDGALAVARTHVMALPLDYVVDWVVGRACMSESCLRLPAVVWGILTLAASYFLFRRLGGSQLAIIAVAFM